MVDLLTTSGVSVHNFCTSKTCFDTFSLTKKSYACNKNAKIKNFCVCRPVLPKISALFGKLYNSFNIIYYFLLQKGAHFVIIIAV